MSDIAQFLEEARRGRLQLPRIEEINSTLGAPRQGGGLAQPLPNLPPYVAESTDYARQQLGVNSNKSLFDAIMALGPERGQALLALLKQVGGPFGSMDSPSR